ncbi:MAG: MFS transporter [Chloroflexota bacterium]|nr:MFS transporter [Chloroflexota bacterium]
MASRTRLADRVNDTNAKWWTLVACCITLFMAILDNLVVNVALPTISRDLNATSTGLQWIVSAYTLVFASSQITAGGLGDRLGRKRWFLFGIALFTATSLLAAFSQNTGMLIAARAVQGFGAAFIMPLSLSLISDAFPPEERGRALGIWSAISVSGLAFGPIVGGLIVQAASWHWVFLINIPVGVLAFLVTSAVVRESRDTSGTVATDIPGTVLVTGALASLTWGLIEAGERGWGNGLILSAFAAALVLFAAFVAVEGRTPRPMVPLRFFRSGTFVGANLAAIAISFLISGVAYSLTLYQQNVHGFSPVRSGLTLLPLVAVMMIGSPISGALINRVGPSKLIALGMLITGGAALLFLRTGADASFLDIVPALVVMGLGNSLLFAPMTTAVLNSVETAKSGVASAVNGAIRETGFAFGVALLGSIMNQTYRTCFAEADEVRALWENPDPALAPLRPVLDVVGDGITFAGRLVQSPASWPEALQPAIAALPADVAASIGQASSEAFVAGMDRAFVISSAVIILFSVLCYWLIQDRVAAARQAPATAGEAVLAAEGAA